MSYVNVVFGNKVLFLLMLLTANLKASSSALTSETGPSVCSNIPPERQKRETRKAPDGRHQTLSQAEGETRSHFQVALNGENIYRHLHLGLAVRGQHT